MAEVRRMGKAELRMHFTEHVGVQRADANVSRADILAPENETDGLLGEISLGSAT